MLFLVQNTNGAIFGRNFTDKAITGGKMQQNLHMLFHLYNSLLSKLNQHNNQINNIGKWEGDQKINIRLILVT